MKHHYIRELRGRHAGRRAVILGKGASVCVWLMRGGLEELGDDTVVMAINETVALPGLEPDYWFWPDVRSAEHVQQFGVPRPGTVQVFEEHLTREEPERVARLAALSEHYVYLRGQDAPDDPYAVPLRASTGSAALVCCRLAGIRDVTMVGFDGYDNHLDQSYPGCLVDYLVWKKKPAAVSYRGNNNLLDRALEGSGIEVTWYHRGLTAGDYAEAMEKYGGEAEIGDADETAEADGQPTGPEPLEEPTTRGTVSLEEALFARQSERRFNADPLTPKQLGQLLWAGQGRSQSGRRTCPSAGPKYPLELYAVTPSGIFHYRATDHEARRIKAGDLREDLGLATLRQPGVRTAGASLVIAADVSRTATRYRDRARRYVLLEAGHCAQNLLLQATALGLGAVPIGAFRDDKVADLLGLPEGQEPLYIVSIGVPGDPPRNSKGL